ncbi:MAG: two-component sensor histidine kinase [Rhodobacteraceae bacterium]|nr:two-component sensor histidine kinase [Paracoccaceae bacterium]
MVLVAASLLVGQVVASRIEDSVVRNTAIATALYMESFVSPISQQLAESDQLSANARRALEEVFTNTPLGERIVSYKVWKPGGHVVEASDKALVGQVFPPSDGLRGAWAGKVTAEFDRFGDDEDAAEEALGLPLLEIYSPIREVWSGDVIAVAEFYEVNYQLARDLVAARRSAWLAVALVGLSVGAVLYLIVLGGSRTIERQRRDLDARLRDVRALSERNRHLRLRVQEAAGRAATTTEHAMRRIGADLHDGPAQYLAFAALRLDDLRDAQPDARAQGELDGVRDALAAAMEEVRAISRGLTLPDIAGRTPGQIARMAVTAHRDRTGEDIASSIDISPVAGISPAMRICIYRFVQEGLNNASRHGGGSGTRVALACRGHRIEVQVADDGPGFGADDAIPQFGLGLSGLRDRIESLGGGFSVRNRDEGGAEISMTLFTGDET